MQDTLERVIALSKADDMIVIGTEDSTANVRWANNTSTTNGVGDSHQLYIVSIIDGRLGVISRNHFPDDRLEDLVRESEAACDGKPKAHDFMALLEGSGKPADWDEGSAQASVSVFGGFADRLANHFARAGSDGVKLFGYAEHETSTIYLATSTGIRKRHVQPQGKFEVTAKSDDFARSAWTGAWTKGFDDVDLDGVYRKLHQRLEWSRKTIDMPAGRYEVLLEPSAVADMLIYSYIMSTARDADEGRTVFSKPGGGNRIGEKLYPDTIQIYSDPYEPGLETTPFNLAIGSSSYSSAFDNGLECKRTEWVRDGTLTSLITPRYWAAKSGADPVPFVGNLVLSSEEGPNLDQMIASSERALLVTCFWYIRMVDPQTLLLTGLTRDGVFLVENGEVKGAVNNFRYNVSPVDMLKHTVELGRSEECAAREFDTFSLTKMPPLRVRDFNMSSVSEAT